MDSRFSEALARTAILFSYAIVGTEEHKTSLADLEDDAKSELAHVLFDVADAIHPGGATDERANLRGTIQQLTDEVAAGDKAIARLQALVDVLQDKLAATTANEERLQLEATARATPAASPTLPSAAPDATEPATIADEKATSPDAPPVT
jgi:uncharacterized coiled-coil protein SlyX